MWWFLSFVLVVVVASEAEMGIETTTTTTTTTTCSPFPEVIESMAPITSCKCGAPLWQVWRALGASTVVIEGPVKEARVSYSGGSDSSIFVAISRWAALLLEAARGEDTAKPPKASTVFLCPPPFAVNNSRCVLEFSPFDDICVKVERLKRFWGPSPRKFSVGWVSSDPRRNQWRALVAIGAFAIATWADWFAEATALQFTIGVSTGVLAMAVLVVGLCLHLCGNGLAGQRYANRLRLGVLVAVAFGYATLLWQTALGGIVYLLDHWPVTLATYCCVSCAASAVGTAAVLRSNTYVPDFVRTACKLAALFLAFNSTHSILFGLAYAVAIAIYKPPVSLSAADLDEPFPPEDATNNSATPVRHLLRTLGSAVSKRRASERVQADIPATNFLHGHRFLSRDEYDRQGRESTARALADLSHTPDFDRWLVDSHARARQDHLNFSDSGGVGGGGADDERGFGFGFGFGFGLAAAHTPSK